MTQTVRRKHHIIYKTTCLITGRWYVGMHSTNNLEDGYLGSGRFLCNSIKKHGKENHKCEILEYLPGRKELRAREKQIVTEELINDGLCMNLLTGGQGGWDFINENKLSPTHTSDHPQRQQIIERFKKIWKGRKHTTETIEKLKRYKHTPESIEKMKGHSRNPWSDERPNPQKGKRWIHHPTLKEAKMVKQSNLDEYIESGWHLGQKS